MAHSHMNADDTFNLLYLQEHDRFDAGPSSASGTGFRQLCRLGCAETYTTDGGRTAWRLTPAGHEAAGKIPAARRREWEEAKNIVAESGGLAGELW